RRLRRIRRRSQRRWRRQWRLVDSLYEDLYEHTQTRGTPRPGWARGVSARGLFVQQVRQPGRGGQGAVGPGAESAAAAQRSDSQSRGDGEGIRDARRERVQGDRRLAIEAPQREVARRDDR